MCINYSVSSVDILPVPNYGGPEGSNMNKKETQLKTENAKKDKYLKQNRKQKSKTQL